MLTILARNEQFNMKTDDTIAAGGACACDGDCGLLGACKAGACACYEGYTGAHCATLDLLPAPPDAGLRQSGNKSNWCGTVLVDEKDKDLFHMYNSDFADCGLGIWETGRPPGTQSQDTSSYKTPRLVS